MKSQYTETQRAMIYGSYLMHHDSEAVADRYRKLGWNLSAITVERIIEKFKNTGSFQNYRGAGRPEIVTNYAEEIIIESLNDREMGLKATKSRLKKEVGVDLSERAIGLHANSAGLVYSTVFPYKWHNEVQILQRRKYAKELAEIDPSWMIFGDESPFYFDWMRQQKQWMFREHPKRIKEIHSNICMHVYGAISLKGKSPLYILPKTMTWDSEAYKEALAKSLLPFIQKHYRTGHYIYIQDQASCHHSKMTSDFLQSKHILFKYQSPNSPDLNPIEHIWGILKTRVYKTGGFATRKDLIERITKEWENLEEETLRSTIEKVLKKNVFPLAEGV